MLCTKSIYMLLDRWTERVDVYAFGIILNMLISKRMERYYNKVGRFCHITWPDETSKPKRSFAHKSMIANLGYSCRDACKLSKLSTRCTDLTLRIPEVIKCLMSLRAVRFYGDNLGIDKIMFRHNRKLKDASTTWKMAVRYLVVEVSEQQKERGFKTWLSGFGLNSNLFTLLYLVSFEHVNNTNTNTLREGYIAYVLK